MFRKKGRACIIVNWIWQLSDLSSNLLPGIFDFVRSGYEPERQDSVVLVVSRLSALMRPAKKLEAFLNVCILQSIV